jgi:hypothetical protein
MENEAPQEQNTQTLGKFEYWIKHYLSISINMLIIFCVVMFILLVLNIFISISSTVRFILSVLFVIAFNPLFSKLNIGEKIAVRYLNFIKGMLKK